MAFLWIFYCLALATTAKGCGNPAIRPRISSYAEIVNGEEAVPHSWPWQASMQTFSGFHFCGGSLINENWVVTAAHCQVSNRHQIVLGEHDRSSNAENIQVMRVAKAITHPRYSRQTLNNDIMLVKLASPVRMNAHVSPVCLARTRDNFPGGTQCMTTGWGRARFDSPVRLQQAAVPLLTNRSCRRRLGNFVTNQMICAGATGVSTCFGDSGGPLVCRRDEAWTLVGITSWVVDNCNTMRPAGFARVTALRAWIDQTIAAN